MKLKKLLDSFNSAIDGIINTVRTERNMKIHVIATLIVLISCLLFDVSRYEFLAIIIVIGMVLAAEVFNTAIEATIDMTKNYYHPLAKVAKNAAAGAVFLSAVTAVIVGYVVFWDKITSLSFQGIQKIRESNPFAILIVIVFVSVATVVAKAIFGEGTPLKGGMPSGHSALSFSMATIISWYTDNPTCVVISYLMAFITAQSRVDAEVHTVDEVVVGGVFGTLLTILIFALFKI